MSYLRKILYFVINCSLFFIMSFSSFFYLSNTPNVIKEELSYTINNEGYSVNNEWQKPFIKVTPLNKKNSKLFDDLFMNFYYDFSSYGVRQKMDNSCQININENMAIDLYSQNVFSITKDLAKDGGYRLDYGLFHTYFSDNELGYRKYLDIKPGAKNFIFISDKLADVLCSYYNLPLSVKSYLELINNKDYYILNIKIDDTTVVPLCINNVIYTDKRSAPRCCEFNKIFGVFSYLFLEEFFVPSFEIDFRSNPFNILTTLNKLSTFDYSFEDFKYEIFTRKDAMLNYECSSSLTEQYFNAYNVRERKYTELIIFVIIVLSILIIYSLIIFSHLKKYYFVVTNTLLIQFFSILLCSFLTDIMFISSLYLIVPTLFFVLTLIFVVGGGRIHHEQNKLFASRKIPFVLFTKIEI